MYSRPLGGVSPAHILEIDLPLAPDAGARESRGLAEACRLTAGRDGEDVLTNPAGAFKDREGEECYEFRSALYSFSTGCLFISTA